MEFKTKIWNTSKIKLDPNIFFIFEQIDWIIWKTQLTSSNLDFKLNFYISFMVAIFIMISDFLVSINLKSFLLKLFEFHAIFYRSHFYHWRKIYNQKACGIKCSRNKSILHGIDRKVLNLFNDLSILKKWLYFVGQLLH